jgi:rare lipoprotein A
VIRIRFSPAARRILPLLLPALLLAACSSAPGRRGGGYYQDDGPHNRPQVDVSAIPDASPRNDPRSASGNKPYTVFGKMYYPLKEADGYRERGIASWYGKKFHGKKTSSGEAYDMYAMTAAHKTLPLPSYVRVRNLNNGRSVTLRVNDRGPFLDNRLIDLSYAAASRLGIVGSGTGIVEVVGVSADQPDSGSMAAQAPAPAMAEDPAQPRLYLQVGAFASRDNAENLRLQLERAEFKPVQVQVASQDQTTLYRVRIGPLASVHASDSLAQRIAGYGIANAFVTVE